MTPETNGISFEIERLTSSADGQFQVTGRWYGVRGRRFVRPTLTVTLKDDAGPHRVLADLEHKPWAAEDGEDWLAAFPLEFDAADALGIELNVAPDISVELAGGQDKGGQDKGGKGAKSSRPRRVTAEATSQASRPVIRDDPARPRPRSPRSPEVERLRERLALAETATTKERTKREAADEALENERNAVRKLQAEVGRLRAELELAGAVQRELETATGSLDKLRREVRDAQSERDRAAAERDETMHLLAQERAGAERLRSQLTDAEAAVRRLTQAGREARAAAGDARSAAAAGEAPSAAGARSADSAAAVRSASAAQSARRSSSPSARGSSQRSSPEDEPGSEPTQRLAIPFADPRTEARERPRLSGLADLLETVTSAATSEEPIDRNLMPRTERPLNPSLRASNWLGRGLALVVIIVVAIAIIVLINSTV